LSAVSLYAWETPVRIAGGDGNDYKQPSIKFGPSGKAYIVYVFKVVATGRNDIVFRTYDGEKISEATVLTAGNPHIVTPFMPDIAVTSNEQVHVAWLQYDRSTRYHCVMYRYFDGKSWGPVEFLTAVSDFGVFGSEDLRIVADSSNNAFICFYDAVRGQCSVVSKYFGKKPTVDFPLGGRSKHVDIVCDDDFVHIAWQHLTPKDYGIFYQKKANKENSRWQATVNLETYGTQRPRVDLDNDGNPFVAYWEDRGLNRIIWLRQWDPKYGLTNRNTSILLSTDEYKSYHHLDFSIKNNNMLCTWTIGAYSKEDGAPGPSYYSYKKSNSDTWVKHLSIPNTLSYQVCSDQTWDGLISGVVDSKGDSAITLYLSDRLSTNNLPVAVINADKDAIFWDEEVVFNSNGSSDSDGTIVKYEWLIVQDNVTLEGSSVTYRFIRNYGALNVRLTVTDNKGGRNFAEKTITVKALYTARSTATRQQIKTLLYNREGYVITWVPNTNNDQAGYNIVKYKIFRKDANSDFQEIGEVNGEKLIFADVTVEAGKEYFYAVSAVDEKGHKSPYDNF
jgi:hypothetical protein